MNINPSLLVKKAKSIKDKTPYTPSNSFKSLGLHPVVESNIYKNEYKHPTPIQDKAIPFILKNKDIIGLASTGTGKTAAFLIPLIHKVHVQKDYKVLIITPTRELAKQIFDEGRKFSYGTKAYFTLLIGGKNIYSQIKDLKRDPTFVVGTPGRIKDLYNRNILDLAKFKSVVLDEVDRMLDMGFIRDITFIIRQLPKERHSLFFSATMSNKAYILANDFLQNPELIKIKSTKASENVNQDVVRVKGANKRELLKEILNNPNMQKVLVFGRTKRGLESLFEYLKKNGFNVGIIHGDKTQRYRQRALDSFKTGKTSILLATDVASRGLDVKDITHVINFELPETYEDYVHRIGRTGRAQKIGNAITFID